jgi:hypothetical protein
VTSTAVTPTAPVSDDAPRLTTGDLASVKTADFNAILREALGDEPRMKRFAKINTALSVERPPYIDDSGCRSWWAY